MEGIAKALLGLLDQLEHTVKNHQDLLVEGFGIILLGKRFNIINEKLDVDPTGVIRDTSERFFGTFDIPGQVTPSL